MNGLLCIIRKHFANLKDLLYIILFFFIEQILIEHYYRPGTNLDLNI